MKARDVMTNEVVCVKEDTSIVEAAKKMKDTDVGSLAVESNDKKVVGIITDRDIVLRNVADDSQESTTCGDIMSTDMVTCSPNTDIDEVAHLMSRNQVKRIPVVDSGTTVGMISLGDLSQVEGLNQEALDALENITEKTDEHYY